jgi:transposase
MQLGLPTSPSTILRRLKAVWVPASKGTTKVGIDDWAFRRGLSYGSILVDLETHRVIELLPDRTVATATRWFKEHPEIEVSSRDRGQDYTTAASQGAPQAVQVADRWHIVHNLTEAVSLVLENYRTQLRSVSQLLVPAVEPEPQKEQASEGASSPLPVACGEPYRTPFIQRVQQTRQRQRLQRYHQLVELQQQGMTEAQMAQRMGLSQRPIRRWLGLDHSPEKRQ